MFKRIKFAFSLIVLLLASHCASIENLQYSNDCCKKKPNKLYITFNEKLPNSENKYEKNYLTSIEYLLKKRNFTIITQFDPKNTNIDEDSVLIDFPFNFNENHQITVGGGRNYRTYINGPTGIIGIKGKKEKDSEPIYSMLIMLNSDYAYDIESKKYSVQSYESLLLKFAKLYSNIIHNIYTKPSPIEGKYFDLIEENFYEIKKENGLYIIYSKKSGNNFLTFENDEKNQSNNHFAYFKGKYTINNQELKLYQFGDMLIIKNPIDSQRNILNQTVIFRSDTYLVKIE